MFGAHLLMASNSLILDSDAKTYIDAIEAADGQSLESNVIIAINNFVVGCKADGIWTAIKASCILAGARTLAGALTPLVGPAPTNVNFVSGNYNRKTGLTGNGTNKYLNSNLAANLTGTQNSCHAAVYRTDSNAIGTTSILGSQTISSYRNTSMYFYNTAWGFNCNGPSPDGSRSFASTTNGFMAVARNTSTSISSFISNTNATHAINSFAPGSMSHYVFADNINGTLNAPAAVTLAFYSFGFNLDLSLFNSRVTTLINAIAAAIP